MKKELSVHSSSPHISPDLQDSLRLSWLCLSILVFILVQDHRPAFPSSISKNKDKNTHMVLHIIFIFQSQWITIWKKWMEEGYTFFLERVWANASFA